MNQNFTKILAIGVLVCIAFTAFAQIPNDSPYPTDFVITDSNGNESTFEYASYVDFGTNLTTTVIGELEWSRDDGTYDVDGDGVDETAPDYTDSLNCSWGTTMPMIGKMALIRRGACFFSQKVLNAQNAGAVGAIICNHTAGDGLVNMLGIDSAELVTIPGIFISYEDCEIIHTLIDGGATINAEFRVSYFSDQLGPYTYGTPVDHILPVDEIQVNLFNVDATEPLLDQTSTCVVTDPGGNATTLTATLDSIQPLTGGVFQFEDYVPSELGLYSMDFTNSVTTDELNIEFRITEDTWMMDDDNITDWIANSDQGFIDDGLRYDFGNFYLTGAQGGAASYAMFSLENPEVIYTGDADSDVFQVRLYDCDPDGDGVGPDGTENDYSNWQVVGFADYVLDGTEAAYDQLLVEFDDPVFLKANGQYLLMIQYDGVNAGLGIPPHYAYGGTQEYPYFNSMVFTDQLYTGGWAGNWHGVIRLHTDNFVGTTDVAPLAANKINVFPNPTSNSVSLSLDLEAAADEVRVGIMDITGKLLSSRILTNIQNDVTQFDVSTLSSGTYFMSVVTPEGFRSVKFSVIK